MFIACSILEPHIGLIRPVEWQRPNDALQIIMMNQKISLIAATDKKIYFFEDGLRGRRDEWVEVPLAQFLAREMDERFIVNFHEKRVKILLVVPDHWLKHQFFPFQSQKNSLIIPFLERKLKTTYPELSSIHNFFRYSVRQKAIEGQGVRVFHLHEPSSYALYDALCRTNRTPRWITTPALLWEERFKHLSPEFTSQASLLIHLHPHEAFLYFFFQGDFIFSRGVTLLESDERWDALLFEINQSNYLFSQKAKSDLNQIYFIGNEPSLQERLSGLLGRPVQMISAAASATALPRELATLEGLLTANGVSAPKETHSITHRRIQQQLKWRPVQWVGILVAAILLVFFIGEHQWLEGRILDETIARSRMRQQQPMALADYDTALVELTEDAKRPSAAQVILTVVSTLPEDVLIHEVKIDSGGLRLEFAATVYASTIDRFRHLLKGLIENLNRRFNLNPPITVEDIGVNIEETKSQTAKTHYKIACKIHLP
jgi:hypothetical protein